jgi:osmotically inducible lipoprotein OsmB
MQSRFSTLQGNDMKTPSSSRTVAAGAAVALALLAGCSNMSQRERDTAAGAAIGGIAGSVLTGGSAVGTVGGAAVGGLIGNEAERKK